MLFISEKHGVTIDMHTLKSIQRLNRVVNFHLIKSEELETPVITVECNSIEEANALYSYATNEFARYKVEFPI